MMCGPRVTQFNKYYKYHGNILVNNITLLYIRNINFNVRQKGFSLFIN